MAYLKGTVEDCLFEIRRYVDIETIVYSIIRRVSKSGMERSIDFYCLSEYSGKPYMQYLSGYIAPILGMKRDKNGAIIVKGCGMDMAFSVVYNLGKVLWPNGTPTPHGTRNGEPDSDGGFALKSEVL